MEVSGAGQELPLSRILETVRRFWGFDRLRPLQEEAIRAGLDQRDSLVVLPTGGGKSLCYQVPPILADRTDVVVSPLISLMKDQVDGLRTCGYPAVAVHSGMPAALIRQTEHEIASGNCRLVFVAPERLLSPGFLRLLEQIQVRAFAIDEAHCISHWGHSFRQEYRRLSILKQRFGRASVHAYTATATPRVRTDIIEQLRLEDPAVLVGRFDRPNLVYRVVPRLRRGAQIREVVDRHRGEAVIVYCITRDDTEALSAQLQEAGIRAAHYHAGMDAHDRRRTQDDFANEKIDVVVATVAFGMGIDRGDVRCVIHAAMPKSIEHYQQETGRAGRDGLEAECVLFYSTADVMRWESLIRKSAEEAASPPEVIEAAKGLLEHMRRFCAPGRCRHRALSEYFGQKYDEKNCNACDICLDEVEAVEDGTIAAQMILSCVARVGERFGASHVVDVLRGAQTERMKTYRHDTLSTYGLMKHIDKKSLTHMVYQLIDQGLLARTPDEYPVLKLNQASWQVLRKQRKVYLIPPGKKTRQVRESGSDKASWQGVDQVLFESLRGLRREIARRRGVPPFIIFSDATLRDMARKRPRSPQAFLSVHGIGDKKLADFGNVFMAHIEAHGKDAAPTAPTSRKAGEAIAGRCNTAPARETDRECHSRLSEVRTVSPNTARRPIGYHIVKTTYGLWLPGHERGSWSSAWDDQIGHIEPHTLHPGDPVRKRMAEERLKHPPVRLTKPMMRVVIDVIAECAKLSPWSIAAVSIVSTHIHLLITYNLLDLNRTINWLEQQMTKAIHQRTDHQGPVWAKGAWRESIFDQTHWSNTIRYIERHHEHRGDSPQPYRFCEPEAT